MKISAGQFDIEMKFKQRGKQQMDEQEKQQEQQEQHNPTTFIASGNFHQLQLEQKMIRGFLTSTVQFVKGLFSFGISVMGPYRAHQQKMIKSQITQQ